MQRRTFLNMPLIASVASLLAVEPVGAQPRPNRTRWRVRSSEGFDAIAFLGPLSGTQLYLDFYGADAAAFAPRLPEAVRSDLATLWNEANKDGFGLLGPNLQVLFSAHGHDATIATLLTALRSRQTAILPSYKASSYWSEEDWAWFDRAAPRIDAIFSAMQRAGFAAFRKERIGDDLDRRIAEVGRALAGFDVISWQEKLTGRRFEPEIQIVLLQFSKPHGIKVQGQTFLQAADYDTAATVRIAAHEMLHPPMPMDGPAATAARAAFERDPLIAKIVRDHDPRWGYTTLKGLMDEDLCQALDQMISEALGVARNPADRWRKSDDGIHVIAAGLYGLLRQDRWAEQGGSIERWLADAAARGRLDPAVFHAAAARVLERPVDALWPVPPDTPAKGTSAPG
ncbi:hypothetical protein [Roseateles sp. L2-2]|uniref:hypothetical protein n=1 Tax=Roseateles sp. L2-2 TaxID=3422597 RepID=UPI003D362A67